MSWGPVFTAPPQPPSQGGGTQVRWPFKGENQGKPMKTKQNLIKANAYAFICMIICICSSTTTYACIAYACKHIRAWHVCTYICLHGMHAYMQASCHMHLHTTPTGGGGISP